MLERGLRMPRAGITSRALGDEPATLELLQVGAAAAAAPRVPGTTAPGFEGQGGDFGGGGASGRY
jgi:uncharacterized membrane protein YgcG